MPDDAVRHNEPAARFEMDAGTGTAVLEYRRSASSMVFLHTEVPPEAQGRGTGGELVRAALDYAREHKLRVVPLCPFVSAYIRRHKEYLDVVPPEHRGKVGSE